MLKRIIGLAALGFVTLSSPTYAEDASRQRLGQSEMNILTDARIGIVKALLQLTPDQAKYWPAVEEAVHARADARYRRMAAFAAFADRIGHSGDVDFVELLRGRADALAQRATGLKKLADAWQPLYQSLSPDQKLRMRVLAARVLRQLNDAVDVHGMEIYDEEEHD